MNNKRTKLGFTLIELLVVVLIIGILASVALPQYQKSVLKSRLIQMVIWMDTLKRGTELYYLENNAYPTDVQSIDINLGATEYKDSTIISPGTPAAFFDDNTECLINHTYSACHSKDFYLKRSHNSQNSLGLICYGLNAIAEAVCKSNSDGVSVGSHKNRNGYVIGQ